jgi:hypothetical protein
MADAILSQGGFDVTQVGPTSPRFGPVGAFAINGSSARGKSAEICRGVIAKGRAGHALELRADD